MRIVHISDTHNQHKNIEIPDGDILIHSGDATIAGTAVEVQNFNLWLGTLPHRHKIFVPGNHDFLFERDLNQAISLLTNATLLIDQEIKIEGLRIYGTPWVPQFGFWAFMRKDMHLDQTFEKIPDDLDILISHGPPFGILDNGGFGFSGSMTLMKAVYRAQPEFHLFGHIHEGYGKHEDSQTSYFNSALCHSSLFKITKEPRVLDL